jgi:apolipoprotein N-acyltransferase
MTGTIPAVTGIVALALAGGFLRERRLAATADGEVLTVALVQGATPAAPSDRTPYPALARYERLTRAALSAAPDVVVWPESATGFYFQEPGPPRTRVVTLTRRLGVPLLFGTPAFARGGDGAVEHRNRAYLLAADGMELGFHDKTWLMPFGEYVPLRALLPGVRPLTSAGETAPGPTPTVLRHPRAPLGVLVCYESLVPALADRLVRDGAAVLVNMTNDAWFGVGPGARQHLIHAVFRAVEQRRTVVRVANAGISAVIGPTGRVLWEAEAGRPLWHAHAVRVPAVDGLYGASGRLFVPLCLAASALMAWYAFIRRRSHRAR